MKSDGSDTKKGENSEKLSTTYEKYEFFERIARFLQAIRAKERILLCYAVLYYYY